MSLTFTIIDDTYSANGADGKKHIFGTISLTNPYSAAGELVNDATTHFKTKFLGGNITAVQQSVAIALAGVVATGKFKGDTNSVGSASPKLQFFNAGLSGTANAGLFVDNTTANISGGTATVEMWGY